METMQNPYLSFHFMATNEQETQCNLSEVKGFVRKV